MIEVDFDLLSFIKTQIFYWLMLIEKYKNSAFIIFLLIYLTPIHDCQHVSSIYNTKSKVEAVKDSKFNLIQVHGFGVAVKLIKKIFCENAKSDSNRMNWKCSAC